MTVCHGNVVYLIDIVQNMELLMLGYSKAYLILTQFKNLTVQRERKILHPVEDNKFIKVSLNNFWFTDSFR